MSLVSTMKSGWLALLTTAFLSVALVGCSKSPILQDLEAFDKLGDATFNNKEMLAMPKKMDSATTDEARAALMGEIADKMDKAAKELGAFKAQTTEVQAVADTFTKGVGGLAAGYKLMQEAVTTHDQEKLASAMPKLQEAGGFMDQATKQYEELVKKNNYKKPA